MQHNAFSDDDDDEDDDASVSVVREKGLEIGAPETCTEIETLL